MTGCEKAASHKRKTCLHSASKSKAWLRLRLLQKVTWTSVSVVVCCKDLYSWLVLWCYPSLLLVSCIKPTLSRHSTQFAQPLSSSWQQNPSRWSAGQEGSVALLVWMNFYSACVYCKTITEDSFRPGVLKLFNQGAGAWMQWQAVFCGCLVSPPNPRRGGSGGSVNTGGRIEDPGGPYLACGP